MYSRIFKLTWPAFVELFLSSLFGAVDLVMIGRLSPAAISGVGITNQPFFLLISVFAAANVGTTALVSWSVGAGDKNAASGILKQTMIINGVGGLALSAIGALTAPITMGLMSNDTQIVAYASNYFRIICYGLVFQAITMGITAALRGSGLTRIPMFYNLGANALNVLLNYLLIYGAFGFPRLEVDGAAWATTISRVIGATAAVSFVLLSKKSPVRLKIFSSWKLDFKIMRRILSIGVPSALEQLVIQSGLIIFNRIVATLGVNAYAAQNICASINSLAFSVSNAFSVSTTTLVGQAIGAGEYDNAERYAKYTGRCARAITFFIALGFIFFGRYLAMAYTDAPDVVERCVPVFYVIAVIQFIQSSQMSKAGALRGAGDTLYPLYASILGIWVFRVLLTVIVVLVMGFGLIGAWICFLVDQTMRSVVVTLRFRSGKWKTVKAEKEAKELLREKKRI